jgi:hypothetical protein
MKFTKQQLKQIIKEEIESLLEQEQDSVESMIYRFMENGAEITDQQAETEEWSEFHDPIDPRTASIERDGKQIASIINDAFVTKEINRDRNDKPGRLHGGATLQKTEDGMPYVVFNVLGNRDVPDMLYRVVDNPNGGITIKVEKAPERMKYNEALEQIIKEEIINVLESAFSGNGRLSEPIEEIGGLRFDHEAPFGRERDPTGPSAVAARGLKKPIPVDLIPIIKQGLKAGFNASEEGIEDLIQYVDKQLDDETGFDLDIDVFNAALDLMGID